MRLLCKIAGHAWRSGYCRKRRCSVCGIYDQAVLNLLNPPYVHVVGDLVAKELRRGKMGGKLYAQNH
ncbi:MAG TPA: hypothetical protein DCY85_01265 [Firmicutes bacterium]|jgi:hypothetical protein|nr:hypothetical protein [Bacillota bacterium]HBL49249.1 hypothetical protein [Bacillota bacterium]HBL68319.1 hypothetical protein [Bacillota bacterium]HBR23653.1 hypothetical protein [Bacillota bacterium]HCF92254.1 hypothetical protein [Bacillota bacterium]